MAKYRHQFGSQLWVQLSLCSRQQINSDWDQSTRGNSLFCMWWLSKDLGLLILLIINVIFALPNQMNLLCALRKKQQLDVGERKKCASNITMTFFMLREKKSWSNDFQHVVDIGLVRGKNTESERDRKNSAEVKRPNVPAVTTRRGLESLPEAAPGMVRELLFCWERERQRERQNHILLLLCWGGREGWRNNLDGLGLIKEKEKNREKDKNSTQCKIRSSRASCSNHLHLSKPVSTTPAHLS